MGSRREALEELQVLAVSGRGRRVRSPVGPEDPPGHPLAAHPPDRCDQARLSAVRDSCPHLEAPAAHVRGFAGIMTRRHGLLALEDWLIRAVARSRSHSFANGIRRDPQAVTAGPALPALELWRHGRQCQQGPPPDVRPRRVGSPSKRVILQPA